MSSSPTRDARPKRLVRVPGWLEDYDYTLPGQRHPPPPNPLSHTVQHRGQEQSFIQGEGYAEMAPLTQPQRMEGYVERTPLNQRQQQEGYVERTPFNQRQRMEGYAERTPLNQHHRMEGYAERTPLNQQHRMEGYAERTPLTQRQRYSEWSMGTHEPSSQYLTIDETGSSPVWMDSTDHNRSQPCAPPNTPVSAEVLSAVRQLQEENRQLRMTVLDVQRQMAVSTPLPVHKAPLAQPEQRSQLNTASALPPWSNNPPPGGKRGALQPEEEDWPLPPPPVVDYVPPSAQRLPVDLVRDLTARLSRLGEQPPEPPTPDYCEPDAGSVASDEWSYEEADRPYRGPHPHQPRRQEYSSMRQVPAALPNRSSSPPRQERTYRGPKPAIPKFTKEDPREFARLKIALENLLPQDATERFKFQVLTDHLKFEEALLIADSYSNSRYPYSDTMASLSAHYGQPHQLALQRIAELMDGPTIRSGDTAGFRKFALHIRALVGMLDQLGEDGHIELQCGSHVARLSAKLPHDMCANFKRYVHPLNIKVPTLTDFANWLEYELEIQQSGLL